jgi:hypothetical protein
MRSLETLEKMHTLKTLNLRGIREKNLIEALQHRRPQLKIQIRVPANTEK